MRASEKKELEEMRDKLVSDIQRQEELVSQGRINEQQAQHELQQRYGPEYLQMLSLLNNQLHKAELQTTLLEHPKLAYSVTIALIAVLAASFLVTPSLGGYLVADPGVYAGHLFVDNPKRINSQSPFTIQEIKAQYVGPGSFTLYLEDSNGRHEILTGNRNENTCTGCAASYKPPYMLDLESDGGSLSIQALAYGAE